MEAQSFWNKKHVHVLLALVLIGAIFSLAAYTQLTLKEARGTFSGEVTISVAGEGEVFAVPDIGQFSFSVRAEGEDAAEAQENSAEAINAILAYLEGAGVEEKDIKTQNYNLNPKYKYEERFCVSSSSYCPPGERVIDGYEVYQSVSVKVRDLDNAGTLISGAGDNGATNISSLQFTIDDESVLQAEARAKAITDAKEKAQVLANDLGMQLNRIVGFNEGGGNFYPQYERAHAMDASDDGGGFKTAPSLPVGENEIRSNVTITYQLK